MAAGDIYRGKNLRILVGGKPIFHATSCSMSVTSSTDEVETKDTQGTIVTPGNISYTLSTDTLVAESPESTDATPEATHVDVFTLLELQQSKTILQFQFVNVGLDGMTAVSGTKVISGEVYINR